MWLILGTYIALAYLWLFLHDIGKDGFIEDFVGWRERKNWFIKAVTFAPVILIVLLYVPVEFIISNYDGKPRWKAYLMLAIMILIALSTYVYIYNYE